MKVRNQPNKKYGSIENRLAHELDRKAELMEFYEEVWPLLKKAAKIKNIDQMLKEYAPTAILILIQQATAAKSEKVRQSAALELLHMSEGKPVQRQMNVTRNVDKMPEAEVDSMIRGLLRAARRENSITVHALPVPNEEEDPKA